MNRTGSIVIQDSKGRDRERYPIVYGARLKVRDGSHVEQGTILVEWDPYTFSILTEDAGTVKDKDLVSDVTFQEEVDEVTGLSRKIVVDSPDEKKQPTIEIRDKAGKVVRKYNMPSHAHLMVEDSDQAYAGQVLAKIPRETTKTKDITGGLPRVVELFEARKPRETAVISEIDGIVRHGGIVKGLRKIIIVPDEGGGEPREYSLPRGVHVNVQEGDRVRAGEPLMDGPCNPHDILSVLGEKALHSYLVNEIQEVYRLQGVNINDKHIEVIVRQMMRWVKIEDVGDTEFLVEEQVDRFRFMEENERVIAAGGRPAQGRPLLLGITKASLSTDSFISAASFQETTRVLTEASISGKIDHLRGLKENVTMGRLIPAGTGFEYYRNVRIPADEPPPPPPPSPEELELEREMEYFVEPEEAFTRDEVGITSASGFRFRLPASGRVFRPGTLGAVVLTHHRPFSLLLPLAFCAPRYNAEPRPFSASKELSADVPEPLAAHLDAGVRQRLGFHRLRGRRPDRPRGLPLSRAESAEPSGAPAGSRADGARRWTWQSGDAAGATAVRSGDHRGGED